ncbi:hypothetical protein VCHA30O60_10576 [Vibrio chagasii]|nr:hypothetical protein VCHA30O60_10576 [Vibrio chagasii]CAH7324843.1 hypothetical protein VCHA54P499_40258 [Vibrio chagasii]
MSVLSVSTPLLSLLLVPTGSKRLTMPLIPATRPMPNIKTMADTPSNMPPKNASQGIKLNTDLSYPQTSLILNTLKLDFTNKLKLVNANVT